jgi:serine/threonine protein kinase
LELCSGSLEDFINDPSKYGTINEADWLHQMAQGVEHIHSNRLVHRDIKPQNILLSKNSDGRVVLKISDFGFCKPTSIRGSYTQSAEIRGTRNYMAPELLLLIEKGIDERGNIASDVFSLGCVFFKFLARGVHPFGEYFDISPNIIAGNSVNLNSKLSFISTLRVYFICTNRMQMLE